METNRSKKPCAPKLKTAYKPFRSWSPIHTGGEAAISQSARLLFTTLDDRVVLTDPSSGLRLHTFEGDSSIVTSLTCTPSSSQQSILIAYRSLALRIYNLEGPFDTPTTITVTLTKAIPRAHDAPISVSTTDPTSSVFATGDTAGVVRLWDVKNGHCTHVFKGHQLVSALTFDVSEASSRARLAVGAIDGRIKLWDLPSSKLVGVFEHGHVSAVRGLAVTRDGGRMVSGGRDKVVIVWDLSSAAGKVIKTIAVYETIESIGLVYKSESKSKSAFECPSQGIAVYTAGAKGLVRLWDVESGLQIAAEEEKHTSIPCASIFDTQYDEASKTLLVIKVDQTLSFLTLPTLKTTQQIVGCHDEIIDAALLHSSNTETEATYLALATNSPLIRVVSLRVGSYDTALIEGHSDVVLCLAKKSGQSWFVSGSKDKTARVWRAREGEVESRRMWECVGVCEGHMGSLGAVSVSQTIDCNLKSTVYLATASQDRTVKLWDLSGLLLLVEDSTERMTEPLKLTSLLTLNVHEKDINTIDFSGDGKLLGTGSQDKLAKIFSVAGSDHQGGTTLKILGILKGHTRGIWTLKFSKHDKTVVTGSADCSIKLWSVCEGDGFGSCLKTFEGHLNAVLRVDFLNFGQQLVSSSSDSLVKVWEIKTQVCLTTLGDELNDDGEIVVTKNKSILSEKVLGGVMHNDKIWALEVEDDEGSKIVTAGADSKIIYWEDLSELYESEKLRLREEELRVKQDIENYTRLKDFKAVITLLIQLDKPVKLLKLFTDVGESEEEEDGLSITGSLEVDQALNELRPREVVKVLEYIRDWNAITRTAEVGQRVLYAILKFHSYSGLLGLDDEEEILMEDLVVKERTNRKKKSQPKVKALLDGLLPYTERHLGRLERLNQEACVVQYLLNQMSGGICEF